MAFNRRKFAQCPNCGYTFEDVNNYCPNCGQENHDLNVPVKHLIAEFFEGTLHSDTKVWRTLKLLLLKPGLLTEKFNIGQRASYVPPFRLYVFVSLIFIFVLAVTTRSSVQIAGNNGKAPGAQTIFPGVAVNARAADSVELATKAQQLRKLEKLTPGAKQLEVMKAKLEEDEFMVSFAQKFTHFTSNSEQSKQTYLHTLLSMIPVSFIYLLTLSFFLVGIL